MTEWTIAASDSGTRLDKFLAAADRLGSRGKAAAALERGERPPLTDVQRAIVEDWALRRV